MLSSPTTVAITDAALSCLTSRTTVSQQDSTHPGIKHPSRFSPNQGRHAQTKTAALEINSSRPFHRRIALQLNHSPRCREGQLKCHIRPRGVCNVVALAYHTVAAFDSQTTPRTAPPRQHCRSLPHTPFFVCFPSAPVHPNSKPQPQEPQP